MSVVIADLLPQPVSVELGRGTVEARGLSLNEIVPLIEKYKDDLAPFFSDDKPNAEYMLSKAPRMAADIIALGINAVGQEDDIMKMPAAAQINCLTAIWNLSVPDVKKLRESLLTVVASVTLKDEVDLLPDSATPSQDT